LLDDAVAAARRRSRAGGIARPVVTAIHRARVAGLGGSDLYDAVAAFGNQQATRGTALRAVVDDVVAFLLGIGIAVATVWPQLTSRGAVPVTAIVDTVARLTELTVDGAVTTKRRQHATRGTLGRGCAVVAVLVETVVALFVANVVRAIAAERA